MSLQKDVDEIDFDMAGKKWRYVPQTNVTALEAARLGVFFMAAATPAFGYGVDITSYVTRYALWRHFVEAP